MKTMFRLLAALAVISLGAVAYAGDAKKEDTTKDEGCACCKDSGKDGCCDKCKAEKSDKDAKKTDEKKPEKK